MRSPVDLHTRQWPAPWRYGLALALFLIALLLRLALLPVEDGLAYLTFYPATVIVFYLCGQGPGALMVALAALSAYGIFTPPFWGFAYSYRGMVALLTFLASAVLIGRLSARTGQALSTLDAREQNLRDILESQTDVICRLKADGTVLYVNDAFCRFFGHPREALVGVHWRPVVHPQDKDLVEQKLASLSEQNPVVVVENRVLTRGGAVAWMQFVNRGFFDASGRLSEVQGVGRDITERKKVEQQLATVLAQANDLYDRAPCAYYSVAKDRTFVRVNDTLLSWLGCPREALLGKMSPADFLSPQDQAQFQRSFGQLMAEGEIQDVQYTLLGRQGPPRRVSVSATVIRDEQGQFLMSRSVMYDITEVTRVKDALRQALDEQKAMLDNALIGIVKTRGREIIWSNKAITHILGYSEDELAGQTTRLLYADDQAFEAVGQQAQGDFSSAGVCRTKMTMRRRDGRMVWIDAHGVLLSAELDERLWMFADITADMQRQDEAEHIALHDALTGLPNRRLLADRLQQALSLSQRSQHTLAVCYLDLDGFKPVNDQHGHAAGDRLLQEIARRLKLVIRANDTACRLGGDEFVLILTELHGQVEHERVLHRLIAALNAPISIAAGESVQVSASIGVALSPFDANTPDALLRQADQAMYQAKSLGRNRWCRWEAALADTHPASR